MSQPEFFGWGCLSVPWALFMTHRDFKLCLRARWALLRSFWQPLFPESFQVSMQAPHPVNLDSPRVVGFFKSMYHYRCYPLFSVVFLGIQLNLRSLTKALTVNRASKLVAQCQLGSNPMWVTHRQLESLVSHLFSRFLFLPLGRQAPGFQLSYFHSV